MTGRKIIAAVTALIGLFLVAAGSYFIWKIYSEDLSAQLLKDQLRSIHKAGRSHDSGIDQGLVDLHNQNSDCIYWIRIPGTDIDYPVMHRPQDHNYYLERDFNGEYSPHGSLFMSEDCDPDTSDNLIIYGHHMQDGSMFAGLEEYKKEEFYKDHKYVELETLHGRGEYIVIAAFAVPVYTGHDFEYYAFTKAEDEDDYGKFVSECKGRSYYDTGNTAEYGQRLLTLSTCEYSHKNGRMVVLAAKTGSEETNAE